MFISEKTEPFAVIVGYYSSFWFKLCYWSLWVMPPPSSCYTGSSSLLSSSKNSSTPYWFCDSIAWFGSFGWCYVACLSFFFLTLCSALDTQFCNGWDPINILPLNGFSCFGFVIALLRSLTFSSKVGSCFGACFGTSFSFTGRLLGLLLVLLTTFLFLSIGSIGWSRPSVSSFLSLRFAIFTFSGSFLSDLFDYFIFEALL